MQSLLLSALRHPAAFAPITKSLVSQALTKPAVSRTLTTASRPTVRRQLLPSRLNTPPKRFFTAEPAITSRPPQSEVYKKLLYGAGVFGGTLVAINVLFNGEKRMGGIPEYERRYLKEAFTYTGLGIGMIGVAAKALHNVGWSYRLMAWNPWVVLTIGLGGSMATMLGTLCTNPDNYVQKHALWSAFNLTQALVLAPIFFYNPAILARAGLYTVGVMGSISYVAATAKEDKYLWLGGPLLAGCAVVVLASFAPMILPVGTAALAGAEAISLYGGLAVFGGFTLYDVQMVQQNARQVELGRIEKDMVNESIRLQLDFINIFIRLVEILNTTKRR